MPDNWHQTTRNLPARIETAAVQKYDEIPSYLSRAIFTYESWQDEAWDYWRNLGEANQAIGWTAASLSRIRLTAAELVPGGDEPEILVTGAAADIMGKFCGGNAGQGMFLEGWGYQGGVPGEGWLVVEREDDSVPLELATWRMMPTSAVRRKGARGLEIRIGQNQWRPLVDEGFAYKIFKPDPQHPWKAWSPMQAALPIMRRIDLIDRRIVALMVSRLAMNGLLIIPQEGEFAVPERYKGKGDQALAAMLIETATQNIKMPGAASAAIPIIIRYAAELIEKWRLLTWPDVLPAELLTEREQEIKRLATTLSVPLEVITGIGDMNHWSAWNLEESAAKRYVAPAAEILTDGLTVGFLHPLLKQLGESLVGPNGGKLIVWYDVSELTTSPDKSQHAKDAYDRFEINGAALRRESGLDETDAPVGDELTQMALKKLLTQPATATQALAELTGVVLQAPASGAPVNGPDGSAGQSVNGEPSGAQTQSAPNTRPATTADRPAIEAGVRVGKPSPRPRVFNGLG